MKKKIKDLTEKEKVSLCKRNCDNCEFAYALGCKLGKGYTDYFPEFLEKEVEV